MIQQEDPIDIINAKIQNDIININELYCFTQGHQAEIAVALTQEKKLMCESCSDIYKNMTGQKTIQIQLMVENLNQKFHSLSQKFLQIQNFYQSEFLNELITYSVDERIDIIKEQFNLMLQNISNYKSNIVPQLENSMDFQKFHQFKGFIQQCLSQGNNIRTLDSILSDNNVKLINEMEELLSQNAEKVIREIKIKSERLIIHQIQNFIKWFDEFSRISFLKNQQSFIDSEQSILEKSQISSSQMRQSEDGINTIQQLTKQRDLLKNQMITHLNYLRGNNQEAHSTIKLEGGGSFGYSWTGGYGVSGTKFPKLPLCKDCKNCNDLNNEMNKICVQLYQKNYRDGKKWWVQGWFLFADD